MIVPQRVARPVVAFAVCVAVILVGCGVPPSLPPHYAGMAANRILPVLVHLQEEEGNVVIADHRGDEEATEEGLAGVEARWAPLWAAWDAFVAAQHAWADAVERGVDAQTLASAEQAAVAAFCAVRKSLPEGVPPEVLASVDVPCPQ